jgi:sugar phosphate isomerase/epimerase
MYKFPIGVIVDSFRTDTRKGRYYGAEVNPEYIYGVTPKPEDIAGITFFREVPLGGGGVNFNSYLKALDEIGYKGFLAIEREVGDNHSVDIRKAKGHLEAVIAAN